MRIERSEAITITVVGAVAALGSFVLYKAEPAEVIPFDPTKPATVKEYNPMYQKSDFFINGVHYDGKLIPASITVTQCPEQNEALLKCTTNEVEVIQDLSNVVLDSSIVLEPYLP